MVVGVQIADVVTKKLILHACKYPSNDVIGIFNLTQASLQEQRTEMATK